MNKVRIGALTVLFCFMGKFCHGSRHVVVHGIYSGTMKEDRGMAVKKNRKLKVYEQARYGCKEVPVIVRGEES